MKILKNTIILIICSLIISTVALKAQKIGSTVKNFSGFTIDKKKIKLSTYKGKVLILTFFASWCESSYNEIPALIELYNEYNDSGLETIAINIDLKKRNYKKMIQSFETKIPFPIIWDRKTYIPEKCDIQNMPTTLIIDKNGVIKYIHVGFDKESKEKYKAQIEKLLEETTH